VEKYTYLFLGVALVLPLICILLWRKDLTSKALKIGFLGGVAGLVAEFFYFKDYWRPPSLMGVATVSIEDFIFGFSITALSFVVYPALRGCVFSRNDPRKKVKLYASFFLICLCGVLFFNLHLRVNSIFVTSAMFIVLSTVILLMRRDLLMLAAYSAAVLTTLIIVIYIVLFNIVSPSYWDTYWLLADTGWGVTMLGNIPLTEILWYVSWIVYAALSYPFVSGRVLSKLK